MPALVSHFIFADSALHDAQPYLVEAIQAAPLAFRWGAQGPDILFFTAHWRKTISTASVTGCTRSASAACFRR